MWSKLSKQTRLLALVCAALLVVLAAVATVGVLLPYMDAKNSMDPAGTLSVLTLEDGSVEVQWPEGDNANGYQLQVKDADGNLLHSATTEQCAAVLPALGEHQNLELRVTSLCHYRDQTREGQEDLVVTLQELSPRIHDLKWVADEKQDTVDISFDLAAGDTCQVYLAVDEGAPVLLKTLQAEQLQLRFGEEGDLPMPEHGQQLAISFLLERTDDNAAIQGPTVEGFVLTREDLLGRDLKVELTDNGCDSYTLTWNETKGEYYDVRLSDDGGKTWMTKAYIPAQGERSCTISDLMAFTDYLIQVVSVGGQTEDGKDTAAEAEMIAVQTQEKFLYSTIWPIMERKVYANPDGTQELGKIPAGSAWCVLGQEGQYLKIRYNGQDAYVDNEYCMINLTEYLGNLCEYDITNSYSSIYLVHEYGIQDVSGTIITGYENVRIREGVYLVPLMYASAQKLLNAALTAREQGYKLKIYDSFRPQYATDSIYQKMYAIRNRAVPRDTYTGKVVTDLHLLNQYPVNEEDTELAEYSALTYKKLMTNNGAFNLSNFLAPGTSRHNFGVAVDLTLTDLDGKELSMQTSMHDLSWYSSLKRNNENANILYEAMTGAGFKSLSSEWWHFQDNDLYNRHLYSPLKTGVSWECWVADQNGWRYRLSDGSFYANCTQMIGEQSYTFDENGYLVQ